MVAAATCCSWRRPILLLALAALAAAFFALGLDRFLSLAAVQEHQARLAALHAEEPLLVVGSFFAAYVTITALSFPGASGIPSGGRP